MEKEWDRLVSMRPSPMFSFGKVDPLKKKNRTRLDHPTFVVWMSSFLSSPRPWNAFHKPKERRNASTFQNFSFSQDESYAKCKEIKALQGSFSARDADTMRRRPTFRGREMVKRYDEIRRRCSYPIVVRSIKHWYERRERFGHASMPFEKERRDLLVPIRIE